MMHKHTLPFIFLFVMLVCSNAYSQGDEEKIRFHVAPLNLFDPVTGVLQVGIQKSISQRLALSLDHGIKLDVFKAARQRTDRKDYKYSKSKIELKYFTGIKKRDSLTTVFPYLAIEGMYFPQEYWKEKDWIHRESQSYRYERADIKRTVWVASLKLGREVKYNKLVIDNYIGLGVRQLTISHHAFGKVEAEYSGPIDLYFEPIDRQSGTFYRPHISLGIKVGYIIK